jgi:hypothetical protein
MAEAQNGGLSGYAGGFVIFSLWYVALWRVLQLAVLRCRSNEFKGPRNRRASARTRHPSATKTAMIEADIASAETFRR